MEYSAPLRIWGEFPDMRKTALPALAVSAAVLLCSCEGTQYSAPVAQSTEAVQSAETTQTAESAQTTENEQSIVSAEDIADLLEYDIFSIEYTVPEGYSGYEFLSEEQQRAFWLAEFVYYVLDLDTADFFSISGIYRDETYHIEGTPFYHTGCTYESVVGSFTSVLSAEIVSELMYQKCGNLNGEFVCGIGARGAWLTFSGILEFQLVSITDDLVEFKAAAGLHDPEHPEAGITGYEEHSFEMRRIDDKWIVTKFEFWM